MRLKVKQPQMKYLDFKQQFKEITYKYSENFIGLKLSAIDHCSKSTNDLIEAAKSNKCSILIDAEQDDYHDKMNSIVNDMLKEHNNDKCVVYKTYQMYRKDSLENLCNDIINSTQKNNWLGIKLVRGAYMTTDVNKDVLFTSKHKTDKSYNYAIEMIIKHMKYNDNPKLKVIFATHNKTSVEIAINELQDLCQEKKQHVYFATLLGMGNHLSTITSEEGYNTMKYVPFGPLIQTLPYLFRRLHENLEISKHIIR